MTLASLTLPVWFLHIRISTIWWPIAFGLIALVFVVLAIYVARKPSKHFVWPVIGALLAISLCVWTGMNAHYGWKQKVNDVLYPNSPRTPTIDFGQAPPRDVSLGVHVNVEIPGPKSGIGTQQGDIWLPQQYFTQPSRKFPVVYLFHGTPGTSNDWFDDADAIYSAIGLSIQRHPVILVAPTAAPEEVDSECVNGTAGNWDTYLSQDVPTWIDANYRLLGGPAHTATAGLSMGGYCAQMLALRYPDKYSVSGNFSGTTAADFEGGLPALFGPVPNLQATIDSYDSSWLVQNRPKSRTVATWLEVGSNENTKLIADQQAFYALAKKLKMNAVFKTVPGEHTTLVWSDAFEDWLDWAIPKIS